MRHAMEEGVLACFRREEGDRDELNEAARGLGRERWRLSVRLLVTVSNDIRARSAATSPWTPREKRRAVWQNSPQLRARDQSVQNRYA